MSRRPGVPQVSEREVARQDHSRLAIAEVQEQSSSAQARSRGGQHGRRRAYSGATTMSRRKGIQNQHSQRSGTRDTQRSCRSKDKFGVQSNWVMNRITIIRKDQGRARPTASHNCPVFEEAGRKPPAPAATKGRTKLTCGLNRKDLRANRSIGLERVFQ